MSKRGKRQATPKLSPVQAAAGVSGSVDVGGDAGVTVRAAFTRQESVLGEVRISGEDFAIPADLAEAAIVEVPTLAPLPAETMHVDGYFPCKRTLHYDSLRWTCCCGGSGPVGRSPDGIPFVNDEILAHAPGETR